MSSITTSYVKLAVSGNENDQNRHIDGQEELLVKIFKDHRIEATIDGERIKVSVDCEDPFFETTFQIKSTNGFPPKFLDVISILMDKIKKRYERQAGTIILQHPALFDERLHKSQRKIATNSVHFGNLWNDEFYNHWTTFFSPEKPKSRSNWTELNKIRTHFDFDKMVAVTVEFRVKEKNGNNRNWIFAKYLISIEGDSIRQLVVDQLHKPLHGDYCKRIYFVLKTPVTIKKLITPINYPNRVLELPSGFNENLRSSEKVLTENKVFCLEFGFETFDLPTLHKILSRLRCRWNIPVEFGRFYDFYRRDFKHVIESQMGGPYFVENPCDLRCEEFGIFLDKIFPLAPSGMNEKIIDRVKERRFTYTYLIEALLSRGSSVKDQLLLYEERWFGFLNIICDHVNDDADNNSFYERNNLCESALEDLLNHVDNRPRPGDLLKVFKRLCLSRRESRLSNQVSEEELKEGYRKVRKVILTPTRKIYLAPEIIMANRAVRQVDHNGTRVIRATLRDDNLQRMRYNQLRYFLEGRALGHLENGFGILGRSFGYLASSNSQMREGGVYFMERWDDQQLAEYMRKNPGLQYPDPGFKPMILAYRNQLGKFEETGSIPKAMARLGQCFTQARNCDDVQLSQEDYKMIPDAIGGKDSNKKPYMYTDGVGCISQRLAEQICKSLNMKFVPSAFQIRFRGFKGMLAIDPRLDAEEDYFKDIYEKGIMKRKSTEAIDLAPYTYKCLFRGSQLKFDDNGEKEGKWSIELVKTSSPTPVTLNKPFINILDQVSALQSLKCHKRVSQRVEELLSEEMDNYSKCIVNEEKCREKLEGMPRRVHFASLDRKFGFVLSTEPFFRSLVKAAINAAMTKLLRKLQIPIPGDLGRSMFGVTDETGQLQYGQVFVRYTENVNDKHPSRHTGKTLTGPVLVTKFPSMTEGDVRMYKAVDIPELHHLKDVIVFPQTGPRSQPDEMAGSDLDGDEYAVIWDPLLYFERNEKAFAYSSDKPEKPFTLEEMDGMMNKFYAEFIKQEDVGVTSTNHLHQSDQFGINSDVCNSIALKNSMALDYSKSGVAPPPLTSEWTENPLSKVWEPPERSERRPDFAINRYNGNASYQSSRLLGQLYRELRCVNDVIMTSSEKKSPIIIDQLINWNNWEEFAENAKIQLTRYNAQIRSIMDTFGIATEAEIFSGCYREIRNRHSEKEQDDMSQYNTESVIEKQMTQIFKKFREQFFEEFLEEGAGNAYMRLTEAENPRWNDEVTDVLRRVCREPTDRMMTKAVAYYRVCYASAQESRDRKLSFGWIAYDILNTVRGKNLLESGDTSVPRLPQFQAICNHRITYIDDDKSTSANQNTKSNFGKFIANLLSSYDSQGDPSDEQEQNAREIILIYVRKYSQLHKCLFIIESWARAKGLISDDLDAPQSALKWYHLALMVIMVATNKLGSLIDENQTDSEPKIIDFITPQNKKEERKLSDAKLDRLTLSFFHYLSSRDFRRLRNLNFSKIGLKSIFMRGEWIVFHTAATQTYYNILLNLRIDELPISTENIVEKMSNLREGDPFVLELSSGINQENLLEKLRENSKCVEIQARSDKKCQEGIEKFVISCRGTIEAINELRDFTIIKLPRYQWQQNEKMSIPLAHLVYHKIMGEKFVEKEPEPPKNQYPLKNRYNNNNQKLAPRKISAPTFPCPRGVQQPRRAVSDIVQEEHSRY